MQGGGEDGAVGDLFHHANVFPLVAVVEFLLEGLDVLVLIGDDLEEIQERPIVLVAAAHAHHPGFENRVEIECR